jgi:hypothetical protein
VPWLSDAVWREWNRDDADAAHLKVPGKPISDAEPTTVTEDDRRRAGRGKIGPGESAAPVAPPESLKALLDSTPGLGYFAAARWPVCCDRLCTLISESGTLALHELENELGSLDRTLLEVHLPPGSSAEERFDREGAWLRTLAAARAGKHSGEGTAFFQCRICGRVYGSYHHP